MSICSSKLREFGNKKLIHSNSYSINKIEAQSTGLSSIKELNSSRLNTSNLPKTKESLKDIILLSLEDDVINKDKIPKIMPTKKTAFTKKKKQQHKNKSQQSDPMASQKLFYYMTKDIVKENQKLKIKSDLQSQLMNAHFTNEYLRYIKNYSDFSYLTILPNISNAHCFLRSQDYFNLPSSLHNNYGCMNYPINNKVDLVFKNYNNYRSQIDLSSLKY